MEFLDSVLPRLMLPRPPGRPCPLTAEFEAITLVLKDSETGVSDVIAQENGLGLADLGFETVEGGRLEPTERRRPSWAARLL